MKNFEYASPRTETEALSLLSSQPGHTEILAGGTDLIGLMQANVVRPERVVNILEVPSLKTIEQLDSGVLAVGAVVTLDVLLDHPYLTPYPALRQAIEGIASMQLQCQGTLGGEVLQRPQCWYFRQGRGLLAGGGKLAAEGDNRFHAIFGNRGAAKFVCNSRLAPALVALNAQVRVIGPAADEEKYVSVEELYRAPRHEAERETSLLPNQLVTHLLVPASTGFNATYEVRHGEGPDYPLTAAAASLHIEGGVVTDARIVLGHVAPIPWLSHEAAAVLIGQRVTEDLAAEAGAAAIVPAAPLSNNEYKVQLAQVAVKRAILRAAGLPTGGL